MKHTVEDWLDSFYMLEQYMVDLEGISKSITFYKVNMTCYIKCNFIEWLESGNATY